MIRLPPPNCKDEPWDDQLEEKWRCKRCRQNCVSTLILNCFKKKVKGGHAVLCFACARALYEGKPMNQERCFQAGCENRVSWVQALFF